jgi:hypothetical protein
MHTICIHYADFVHTLCLHYADLMQTLFLFTWNLFPLTNQAHSPRRNVQGSVRDPARPRGLRSDPRRPSSEQFGLPRHPGRHHPLHRRHGVRSEVAYSPWLQPCILRLPADVSFCVFSGYRGLQIPCSTRGIELEGLPPPGPGLGLPVVCPGPPADAVRHPSRTQDSIPSLTGRSQPSAYPGVASRVRKVCFKFSASLYLL